MWRYYHFVSAMHGCHIFKASKVFLLPMVLKKSAFLCSCDDANSSKNLWTINYCCLDSPGFLCLHFTTDTGAAGCSIGSETMFPSNLSQYVPFHAIKDRLSTRNPAGGQVMWYFMAHISKNQTFPSRCSNWLYSWTSYVILLFAPRSWDEKKKNHISQFLIFKLERKLNRN